MSEIYEKLKVMLSGISEHMPFNPEIGIVLGSGLGGFADRLKGSVSIPYEEIPGFPVSTVEGHAGRFVFGRLKGKNIVCMQGRVHYYEGYSMGDVVMPVRLMGMMGVKELLLTNAAGGVNPAFAPGDLMCIRDHISCFVPSPLRGGNVQELGPRFHDMTQVYDEELSDALHRAAKGRGISLKDGVYIQLSGPNYETPAEIKMCAALGADAVGMSTAVEAMAARHAGIRVCAISLITNMASGISKTPLSHAEVQEAANKAAGDFVGLLEDFLGE